MSRLSHTPPAVPCSRCSTIRLGTEFLHARARSGNRNALRRTQVLPHAHFIPTEEAEAAGQ